MFIYYNSSNKKPTGKSFKKIIEELISVEDISSKLSDPPVFSMII